MKTMIAIESSLFNSKMLAKRLASSPLYQALHNKTWSYTHDIPGSEHLSLADGFLHDRKLLWNHYELTQLCLDYVDDQDNAGQTYVYIELSL